LKLNVSDKTISKWEAGTSYPEITMLSTIAKALEMDVNEFFGVEDLKEKKINMEEHESMPSIDSETGPSLRWLSWLPGSSWCFPESR
jgi:transcriptional regulator with XRE-family HTH domain